MSTTETKLGDRFVRRLSEYRGTLPNGVAPFDWVKRIPGPHFDRVRMIGDSREAAEKTLRTDPDELLACGAACGVCNDGVLRHFHPSNQPEKFVGFLIANVEPGRALVWVRGRTVLNLREVQQHDIGKPVYVIEPNLFTLMPVLQPAGDSEIGRVVFLEDRPGYAVVAFKSADDNRPLDLRVSR